MDGSSESVSTAVGKGRLSSFTRYPSHQMKSVCSYYKCQGLVSSSQSCNPGLGGLEIQRVLAEEELFKDWKKYDMAKAAKSG